MKRNYRRQGVAGKAGTIGCFGVARLRGLTFQEPVGYLVGPPANAAIGGFNHDGRQDLAFAGEYGVNVELGEACPR